MQASSHPFVIGVAGHQHLGNEATRLFVEQHFRAILQDYQHQEKQLVVLSALAKGADQLFVQIALELGVRVEIVLPCAGYEDLFSEPKERESYQALLQACQATHQLSDRACTDDAFLAAQEWMVQRCNLLILAWNGLPPLGRGGTADMANYARAYGRPYIHIDTRCLNVHTYTASSTFSQTFSASSPKREHMVAHRIAYQGPLLSVKQYHFRLPDGQEIVRDVLERPESVLLLPVGQGDIVLLIEEYNLGAGCWQLTLPGGKREQGSPERLEELAQKELRQEIGYQARRLEPLIEFYSHPGYVTHHVHVLIASDLEWNPLPPDPHEEIRVLTFPLQEALSATFEAKRFDPEAALALHLYAARKKNASTRRRF
ncbi:8-oxo-dGTP pyrophosphatase MutT (NUDIX family) [Thermosporothrix hazakensis]|jgi:8-oxo-dGTP pyrophosphatase MutT (NUDIX family)|uniref:8-oxo-dGTP pyrophosphatase MutT (NUDIX family) n=1 Tax=Thermosporothrix hazakensis TaxID=644383 RepID=A0A326TYG4_THEHA|nr:NUDIX hydrolase [Thermosporothrix hazakensis]PZW20718.1 8-oxo-dGTP pyrophosphatase MutT (NUDIX family) [Thermosporothrix hazakensis]GCE49847.1 hypothetical protein KTH_47160 [Thermosporothrix hazakensis]